MEIIRGADADAIIVKLESDIDNDIEKYKIQRRSVAKSFDGTERSDRIKRKRSFFIWRNAESCFGREEYRRVCLQPR